MFTMVHNVMEDMCNYGALQSLSLEPSTITQKSKGVKCLSHVALVNMECQAADDPAYMKGKLELTMIVPTTQFDPSYKQSH